MVIVLLIYLLLAYVHRTSPICLISYIMQAMSVLGALMIGYDIQISTFSELLILFFTIGVNIIVISSWKSFVPFQSIMSKEPGLFKNYSNVLMFLSALVLIVFTIITVLVYRFVDNIDAYKYGGENEYFLQTLPIPGVIITLVSFIYPLAFLLIPISFYYLYVNKYRYAIFCLLCSTGAVMYGLSFFSRWVPMCYILLFVVTFFLFKNLLPDRVNRIIKRIITIIAIICGTMFMIVTFQRFGEDTSNAASYSENMSSKSLITDPTLYSMFDYLSQSIPYGQDALSKFRGCTFSGQQTFNDVLKLLNSVGLVNYDSQNFSRLKSNLLGEYDIRFLGITAASVYDFGFLFTMILSVIYNLYVRYRTRRKNVTIEDFEKLFPLMLLPIMSIFFSLAYLMINILFFRFFIKSFLYILYKK